MKSARMTSVMKSVLLESNRTSEKSRMTSGRSSSPSFPASGYADEGFWVTDSPYGDELIALLDILNLNAYHKKEVRAVGIIIKTEVGIYVEIDEEFGQRVEGTRSYSTSATCKTKHSNTSDRIETWSNRECGKDKGERQRYLVKADESVSIRYEKEIDRTLLDVTI